MVDAHSEFTLHASGGADDLFDLHEWFNDDRALRGRATLVDSPIQDGEMGVTEVLVVAVGASGTLTALASSLSTWFTVRQSDIKLTFTRGDGEITIDAKGIGAGTDVEKLLRQLLDHRTEQ
ncbi:effector-associated constant component EACC1 [Nocardia australiensis]|uniref:effector-associated constant component EACC1 n=1 Tax=Nocardia australiensis TaxID=2887191 RepID=UPI001D1536BD|nr:hypothetical protein [Nocardia australiensis]